MNSNIEPVEIIDSAIYAVFLKKELQRTIEELPVTEERKVEYLGQLAQIIRDILFTRALNEIKGPSDIKRVSMTFGIPEETIRAIVQPKKKPQKNYRKNGNYKKSARDTVKTQEQKKNEQEKDEQKKGGDSE